MRALLVEDDAKISAFVRIGLESNGFLIDTAFDSAMGEKLALSKKYDVIILDVVIPGITGFELCRKIRNSNIFTPVILLTSLDSVEDKVTGFDCGADDYLTKPFSFQELYARIRTIIRRNSNQTVSPLIKISDLILDSMSKKVTRNNKEVLLSATEYKILELLMSNKNKVLSRIYIAEKIWGYSFDSGTNVIDVHINSLRKKIDKDSALKLIHTKKGFGYFMTDEEQKN